MSKKATKPKDTETGPVLADVYLQIFEGKNHVFVKVASPSEIDLQPAEVQVHIRRFYRWCAAELGMKPEDVWDRRMGWAVLPKHHYESGARINIIEQLQNDFSVTICSRARFLRQEEA